MVSLSGSAGVAHRCLLPGLPTKIGNATDFAGVHRPMPRKGLENHSFPAVPAPEICPSDPSVPGYARGAETRVSA